MTRISPTTRILLCTLPAALALTPIALAQAAPAPGKQRAETTTTVCSPEKGMAAETGYIYGGRNGKVPSDELAMGQGCLTTTRSGDSATLTFKVKANSATRKDKDSPWVPAEKYYGSGTCQLFRVDKNGHFTLKDKEVTKRFEDVTGPVDTCELTGTFPTAKLRDLQLRWGVSTSVGSSAYVTDAPINAFIRADATTWKPGTVCDPSPSTWLDGYSEDGSRSVSGRGCVTTAKDGTKVKITANVTGTSYAKALGWWKETNYDYQIHCQLRKRTNGGWERGPSGATGILNGSGQVTGCSLNTSVPAKDIGLYDLYWGFGRGTAATPTAAAEVANTIYPLW
ncbi:MULTISPECIES: hypothetical protein [unclassified Streptomyces]|uniref:hypothetical protein n=1 Tax=unclassified Streptomyces TaxID=2593676 RepID=UPI003655B2CD